MLATYATRQSGRLGMASGFSTGHMVCCERQQVGACANSWRIVIRNRNGLAPNSRLSRRSSSAPKEAFALIGKAGIDRAQYLDILTNTLFGAPVYKTHGSLIAQEHYTPAGFKAELGYKDVGLALSAARELKAPMPLASFISDRFLALLASRGGDLDWSALALLAERDAGGETPLRRSE